MKLLLDAMCGGLRAYLRMAGHDAAYALDRDAEADSAVLALADAEDRTVITRDEQLAAAGGGILLTERESVDQLRELAVAGVDLTPDAEPSRCGRCNGRLDAVDQNSGTTELPEYVPDDLPRAGVDAEPDLWHCRDCGQYFWKGSHWARVERTLADVRRATEGE
ncbi:hypothetical protein SAMN06269185_2019 [Natronoarchaeum philippinense]|uniref:Mut7-C RNAse domain-containing protein n=1 Tax=Natronoarchaeum philippinense TaxID=558529 RepID=A0A285NU80_NATPI|nr:DUF5615 family PIN-like protein [Natronoarchaeum philippinense]SNZ13030.1 hypothetical protein SAMN06269185_2019 [Natronoarchaeum philippinense]